ncbi:MAG: tetratricopeptide repeat protein [Muribaculaceae bacterium]
MLAVLQAQSQINTDQVMNIGRNALYFEDYLLSIQYFNQVVKSKPYLAEPYFFRAIAKLELEDYKGAEEDCTLAIERNPFIVDAYQVRGIARQTLKDLKGAIADYETGLKYLPEHKTFLMNKAVCEESLKEYDKAEATYEKLLSIYPKFDNAFLGRAQLRMSEGDTINALADINKCLDLSKNISSAYVMRAEIRMKHENDYKSALADMDEAIKLEPNYAGYFINRAFMKYNLDDYFGAMADYNYAVGLDPTNVTAHFNRGLMLTEVSENNKAIEDFSYVLRSQPENFLARYNRALLYYKTGQYKQAIEDFDIVLRKYPNFEAGLYARSECKRKSGDMAGGERDYNRSRELYKKKQRYTESNDTDEQQATEEVESESAVMNKFNTLLTVETDNKIKPKYENKTRGRIQDNNVKIDPEPMFFLSYYMKEDKLRDNTNYIKEVTDLNTSRLLPFTLVLSNATTRLFEDQIKKHFNSIEYYNGLLATSKARSVDYFARAMDFMMVRNSEQAIADFSKAIESSPDFALAYLGRSYAKYLQLQIEQQNEAGNDASAPTGKPNAGSSMLMEKKTNHVMGEIVDDLNKVIELSPRNVYAMFNKGNAYMIMKNYTSAISCYTDAIETKPDFGEAYYNRGLMYLKLGNKEKGVADLSKAGELGILPSYNVLKRMTR